MHYQTDVVIIGAGPVGLFSIFECGMLKLSCHVIDALDIVGGQCAALYPEKPIYDIPAWPEITGQGLIDHLYQQIEPFSPTFHLGQQVTEITELNSEGRQWRIRTSAGHDISCKSIIIAAGVGAFGPNKPPIEGLETFEEKSVFYYIKNKEQFRDKKIVIAGGGDSAVDWAIALSDIAARTTVVHRRSKFRAAPETAARLNALAEAGKIDLVTPFQLERLEGTRNQLEHVVVKSFENEERRLEADALLPFFGLSMNLGPVASWGLGLDKNHIAVDGLTAATNRPGIFAIGDVATYPHKLKLILTGFSEGAQAAHAIRRHLFPEEVLHFEYSTTKGIPTARDERETA